MLCAAPRPPDSCLHLPTHTRTALARVQFAQYLTAALCMVVAVYAYSFLFPVRLTSSLSG